MADERRASIDTSTTGGSTTITHIHRELKMYNVTEEELDTLNSELPNLSIGFFFFSMGCAVAFGILVFGENVKPKNEELFRVAFWGAVLLSAFFAAWSIGASLRRRRVVKRVRRRPKADAK